MSNQKSNRFRNFATIIYPDNVNTPSNWLEIVDNWHVNAFLSPLHDKDVNPEENEPKKPHYHLLLLFDGKKSDEQIKALFDEIGGVGLEHVQNVRSMARYLCHLDNPDKFQYSPEDVRVFGCEDYFSIIGLPSDKYLMVADMLEFCSTNSIFYFCDLLMYAKDNRPDWFRSLCDNTSFVMGQFFRSFNARMKKSEEVDE